jgi:hypothetical protein
MTRRGGPPDVVPTLTEVIDWPADEATPQSAPVEEPPPASTPQPIRDPVEPVPEREPPRPPSEPEHDPPAVPDEEPPPPVRAESPPAHNPPLAVGVPTVLDEQQLAERILLELQRQIDVVVEYRVREVLTPILNRATDAIVRDARSDLSKSLRDLVGQAVVQELRRQRDR